ncbi:MAG: cytosine permease [Bacillota bacterium]|nr:cytosine permease [Bacillota bacterium]
MDSRQKGDAFEKYALEAVPQDSRQPWYSIALIWIGVMICVPALMMGGALITGLTLPNAFLAGVIGYTIVVLYMSFQGMQAADLGRPTVITAGSAFGITGSRVLISFVLGIACLGWFGVQANVCGAAFSSIMKSWTGVSIPVWLSSLVWGVIMLATAMLGFNALKYLNYVAVPSLVILSIYGTYVAISKYGLQVLSTYQPPTPFSLLQGIALAVGTFAVGGVIAGDYSRYAKGRKDAILSSVIGVWPAGVAMLFMGAVMAVVAGSYDITIVLTEMGIPAVGLIILILATWTTNTVNAYSGGLAITNMFKLSDDKRALATAVAGGLGTVLAVAGILNYFLNYLMVLTSGIPPVAGVMIADYWVLGKGDPSRWSAYPGVNRPGVLSWLLGVVAANAFKAGIAPVTGIAVSMLSYLIITALKAKNISPAVEKGV